MFTTLAAPADRCGCGGVESRRAADRVLRAVRTTLQLPAHQYPYQGRRQVHAERSHPEEHGGRLQAVFIMYRRPS